MTCPFCRTTQRRAERLADALGRTEALVVEDDSAHGISPTSPVSLGSWLPDQTVHIRSFSKSHGPDLRLAAMSGPPDLLRAVDARRHLGQGWSSRLLQRILVGLLTHPAAVAQVAAAGQEYLRRRRLLVDALANREVFVGGTEGINIWVPVHDEAAAIVRLAGWGSRAR